MYFLCFSSTIGQRTIISIDLTWFRCSGAKKNERVPGQDAVFVNPVARLPLGCDEFDQSLFIFMQNFMLPWGLLSRWYINMQQFFSPCCWGIKSSSPQAEICINSVALWPITGHKLAEHHVTQATRLSWGIKSREIAMRSQPTIWLLIVLNSIYPETVWL